MCHKVLSEFLKTNAPDPHNWILSSCFHAFLSVWVHLGPFRYHTKLRAKRVKLMQLMQKFVPRRLVRIFATNARDPHHWTLNSCFGAFLFIWVHLRPFGYCKKLGAKWANLVQLKQKFEPRCLIRIFCNACSRSTPLDPKLTFWCISFHLGAFETIWLLQKSRCKMGQLGAIKAEVRATKSRQKFSK